MRNSRETKADSHFSCTDSERAAFEAGIKLGAMYHQFVGVPLSIENVEVLERAMEAGVRVQPFVEDVKVRIDRSKLKPKRGQYDYTSLTGDMLDVTLTVRYKQVRVEAVMRYVKDMSYPLMSVREIKDV
jgi:hypothetical protein